MAIKITGNKTSGEVFINDNKLLNLKESQKLRNHSESFSWGYLGSGCSQTALAILLELTDDKEIALRNYQKFKEEVISRFPQTDFAVIINLDKYTEAITKEPFLSEYKEKDFSLLKREFFTGELNNFKILIYKYKPKEIYNLHYSPAKPCWIIDEYFEDDSVSYHADSWADKKNYGKVSLETLYNSWRAQGLQQSFFYIKY